jgi:hypothetical protein
MPTQTITFTEWTPDLPSVAKNLANALNVVPTAIGYAPFPTAVDYSASHGNSTNVSVVVFA